MSFTYTLRLLKKDKNYKSEYIEISIDLKIDFCIDNNSNIERIALLSIENLVDKQETIENTAFFSKKNVTIKRSSILQFEFFENNRQYILT